MSARTRTAALGVAAILLGPGLSACQSEVGSSGDTGYVSGRGVITRLPVAEREMPGEVSGETIEGRPISLADYVGKTVVVNVWGSWCPPCRAETPELVAAAGALADQDVAFLGINSRDLNQAAARAFVRRFEVPYPSIYDQQGETLLAFRGTLTPNSIPSTVIIDDQGRVSASVLGQVSESTLVGLVEDVQNDSPGHDG
ncbi:MAG: TlpA family protein disulfide reductase [Actinomycetota bacterium]|nr:TlpA family protein disulfide reductase [Actinomycetota bacterium]